VSDDDYEYVSAETIQQMILWCYKVTLRLSFFLKDVTLLHDASLTVKTSLLLFATWQLSNVITDAVFLWIGCNLILVWPLLYLNKRAEIDRIADLLNHKLDLALNKIPFLKKLEKEPIGETKKTQ